MAKKRISKILLLAVVIITSFSAGIITGSVNPNGVRQLVPFMDKVIPRYIELPAKQHHKQSSTRINSYFSPEGGAEDAILREINKKTESIYVALYFFTKRELALALIEARQRGATVEVLLDKSQENRKDSLVTLLLENNIPVYIDTEHRIMHHKFAVLGKSTIITGSQNWTISAEHRNAENTLVIRHNYHLAGKYRATFNILKKTARPLLVAKIK